MHSTTSNTTLILRFQKLHDMSLRNINHVMLTYSSHFRRDCQEIHISNIRYVPKGLDSSLMLRYLLAGLESERALDPIDATALNISLKIQIFHGSRRIKEFPTPLNPHPDTENSTGSLIRRERFRKQDAQKTEEKDPR